jgi:hypothetical protein
MPKLHSCWRGQLSPPTSCREPNDSRAPSTTRPRRIDRHGRSQAHAWPDRRPKISEDLLTITRIAAGQLWFHDSIGPVTVPKEASKLDEVSRPVNALLVKGKDGWDIDEVGNVYPS